MEAIAVLVQTRMKDLGITVTLSALAPAQYQQQYFTRNSNITVGAWSNSVWNQGSAVGVLIAGRVLATSG